MSVVPPGADLTDDGREPDQAAVGRGAEICVTSRLDAPAAAVWNRITTAAGVNDEMRPILRMSFPRGMERLDPETVEPGRPLGRCRLLLFGLIPIDYDDLTLIRIEPGRGFHERSRMLTQRLWEHQRTLEPAGPESCLITDRVAWQPRLGLPGAPLRPLIRRFFDHRHRRLRRRFGGRPA
jgi:hypothetical protein